MSLLQNKLSYVWLVLLLLSLLSWWSGTQVDSEAVYQSNLIITMSVFVLALIKSRLAIRHFMDVKVAPLWLRLHCDGWLLLVFLLAATMVTTFYWIVITVD